MEYCNGKAKYDKRGALTAKNSRWDHDHIPLRIYNCPDCNGWHLTKTNVKRKYGKRY